MNRFFILVFLLLSAFYAISNEQMGGSSISGQMGDSSGTNNGWSENSGNFAPGSFSQRTPQPSVSKPKPFRPSMQRTETEPRSLQAAPGSQPVEVKKELFIDMPELVRPEERPRQMEGTMFDSSSDHNFEYCHGFYSN